MSRPEIVLFYQGPFSQFHPSFFSAKEMFDNERGTREIREFTSAEQWMMYHKALLFQDYPAARSILSTFDPVKIKRAGRNVQGFDEKIWDQHKTLVVTRGNIFKFSSDPKLKEILLNTGDKILAEASPTDLVWGIGYRSGHPNAKLPHMWRGSNLLGKCLMTAREMIRNNEHNMFQF